MFKYTSTYEDWNGTKRTEDFYFGLTEADLAELEISREGGFTAYITKVSKAKDSEAAASAFKKIILMAYGIKSDDGRFFRKSKEISAEFTGSPVYSELYMRMARDAKFAIKFLNGILPKNMQKNDTELYKAAKDVENGIAKDAENAQKGPGFVEASSEDQELNVVSTEIVEG